MDRISNICFGLILIGIYWIAIVDSQAQCREAGYFRKCQVCADDKICPKCSNTIPNVECGPDNRCRCKKGFGLTSEVGYCVQATTIVKHGDVCDSSQNILCNVTDDILICRPGPAGKCVCSFSYHWDEEVGRCIHDEGLILDVCSAKPDTCRKIPEALKCVKNRCLVQKGYKYNCTTDYSFEKGKREHNETCNEESCSTAQPGCDPCNLDKHLECKNGNEVCDCKSGYYWNPNQGKCIAGSQKPGDTCNDNTRLSCDPNEHLECENGFCACIYGYALDDTTKKCVNVPVHHEDCSRFLCHPIDPNMVCNPETTKCECKEGYEYYTALMKCVRYREFNETCESVNCNRKSHLECKDRTFCVCKEGFKYDENDKRCKEDSKWWMWFIIGFVIAVLLSFAILGSLGFCLYYRKYKKKIVKKKKSSASTAKEVKGKKPRVSTVKEAEEVVKKSNSESEVTVRKSKSSIPGKRKSKSLSVSRRLTRSSLIPSKKLDEALKGVGAW